PDKKRATEAGDYYTKALRTLEAEVINTLNRLMPGAWDLLDVFRVLTSEERLRRGLSHSRSGRELARFYPDGAPNTAANLISTVHAELRTYEPLACAWRRARDEGRALSLREWADRGGYIVHLGMDTSIKGPVQTLNTAVLNYLAGLLLAP